MNFPGTNTLTLSHEALCMAIEGTLNAARRDGEDFVRVTDITQEYSYSSIYKLTITTDSAKPEAVELREVA